MCLCLWGSPIQPKSFLPACCADLCAAQVLEFLNHTSQLMQDTSELVLIIFA